MIWIPKKGGRLRAYSTHDGREFFDGQFGVLTCTKHISHGKGKGGVYRIWAEDAEGRQFTLDLGDWEFRRA